LVTDTDTVWKALADPTRRAILDLLRERAHTTGELSGAFPSLTRFAVMKHLGVLEEAGLVVVSARGGSAGTTSTGCRCGRPTNAGCDRTPTAGPSRCSG